MTTVASMVVLRPMRFLKFVMVLLGAVLLVSCSEIRQPMLEASATTTALTAGAPAGVPGASAQLTVTRQFPGGPIENVTALVKYTVIPRDVVKVSATGLVEPGSEPGTADVHIGEPDDQATTTIRFTVAAAAMRVVSIRLDPTPLAVVLPGAQRRFGALATMSDGTEENITNNVKWQSSNEAAATVGTTQGDIGLVTGIAAGETTITAVDVASNVEGRTTVLVQGQTPVLAAINVLSNPATVTIGKTTPLVAIGVLTNGTTQDLTHTATWTSSDTTKATVDANGVVAGIAAGSVTITAAGPQGLVKGSTAVTIQ